jgi:GTP-binding protein HflX
VLHVADASAPDLDEQMGAVREVLGEIGAAQLPEVLALNKWDLLDQVHRARIARRHPDGVPVSALTGEGVDGVLERLAATVPHPPIEVKLLVPLDRPDVLPLLYRRGEVISTDDRPEGTYAVARVSPADLPAVEEFVVEPTAKRSEG